MENTYETPSDTDSRNIKKELRINILGGLINPFLTLQLILKYFLCSYQNTETRKNMVRFIFIISFAILFVSCKNRTAANQDSIGKTDIINFSYTNLYDSPKNEGQYWLPEMTVVPQDYYVCVGADFNDFGRYNVKKESSIEGLQYANMCGSLAGLINRGVQQGKTKSAVWLDGIGRSFDLCKQRLTNMGINEKTKMDGLSIIRSGVFSDIIKGYVLTDVKSNPESSVVAAVASHIYNAIIIDVRDSAIYNREDLKLVYDATKKTTKDSWKEFKNKCNNRALILMPALTNDLKDFAIANNLFVINIKNNQGNNWELLDEVLDWLEPCSPVYGWEDFDEHSFVQPVSEKGHMLICNNFSMNMSLTSLKYKESQEGLLVNVLNPKNIDYSTNNEYNYVSYYLSDGDNLQWVFHAWYNQWFNHPQSVNMRMSYGIPSTNLDMVAPAVYKNIVDNQNEENTLVENCGGGYIYIDAFAAKKERPVYLANLSKKVAANMRQHCLKVLGLFTNDARSAEAKEAYQYFIKANDQLEGIIVVQYAPYNGGKGEIFWFKNSKGFNIPVITVKYTIWNFGYNEEGGQGTPTFIAQKIKNDASDFSLVDIHAWSSFTDIGTSNDILAEASPGMIFGAGAAAMCQKRLSKKYKNVSLQEFIWRLRMKYHPKETQQMLKEIF